MNQAAFLALLLLAACGHDVALEAKPVDVPVSVPCKAPIIARPIWATTTVNAQSTMFQQARALAATNEQRKAYETNLGAANQACQ